jgi:predicted membrane metal-binding protein
MDLFVVFLIVLHRLIALFGEEHALDIVLLTVNGLICMILLLLLLLLLLARVWVVCVAVCIVLCLVTLGYGDRRAGRESYTLDIDGSDRIFVITC